MKKIGLLICILFVTYIILINMGIERFYVQQYYHFSDCSLWSKKSETEISDFFRGKSFYIKSRGIIYLSECKIKQATPFIISNFGTMNVYPDNKLQFLTMEITNRFSADETTNFNLLNLWQFSNPQLQQEKMIHYSTKELSDYWHAYYLSNHSINKND